MPFGRMLEPRRGISASAGYWCALRLMTCAREECTTTVTPLSPPLVPLALSLYCIYPAQVGPGLDHDYLVNMLHRANSRCVPIRAVRLQPKFHRTGPFHASQILVVFGRCQRMFPCSLRKFWRTDTLAKYVGRFCPSDCDGARILR